MEPSDLSLISTITIVILGFSAILIMVFFSPVVFMGY